MPISRLLATLFAATLFAASASAQQAGTVDYNSRVLPAHGVGDTRSERLSWGAASMGDDGRLGWATNEVSEEQARRKALQNCADRGGTDCVVEAVYANGCIAIAANSDSSSISTAPDLPTARRKALERCGADCEIFRDDCSRP